MVITEMNEKSESALKVMENVSTGPISPFRVINKLDMPLLIELLISPCSAAVLPTSATFSTPVEAIEPTAMKLPPAICVEPMNGEK